MRVVCLSDTHRMHNRAVVPAGDLLIHAGDFTNSGTEEEVIAFNEWLLKQPHAHKVVVPGNHDWLFQRSPHEARMLLSGATCLIDEEITINGIRIYGTPWTPPFMNWAFMKPETQLIDIFSGISPGLDILISHGPAKSILDMSGSRHCGSSALLHRIWDTHPRFHVFGHIHEGYGTLKENKTLHINASAWNRNQKELNAPIVFDVEELPQKRAKEQHNDKQEGDSVPISPG